MRMRRHTPHSDRWPQNFDWDFAGAVRHFEQALAVAPASATTRQWLT